MSTRIREITMNFPVVKVARLLSVTTGPYETIKVGIEIDFEISKVHERVDDLSCCDRGRHLAVAAAQAGTR